MLEFGSNAVFTEQIIEQLHNIDNVANRMFANVRGYEAKDKAKSQRDAKAADTEVQQQLSELNNNKRRVSLTTQMKRALEAEVNAAEKKQRLDAAFKRAVKSNTSNSKENKENRESAGDSNTNSKS